MSRVTRNPRAAPARLSNPRSAVNDRPGRWQMLLRRWRRLLRPGIWVVCLGAVALLVLGIARSTAPGGTLTTTRERFGNLLAHAGLRVQNVVVEGRNNTPEPLLHAAIGVSPGDPILGFSVAGAKARIESLAWVQSATVERRLPGTIVVSLVERPPYAIWQNQGKFVLIDRNGQVVADQDVAQFNTLPLVVGIGAPAHAAELLELLKQMPEIRSRVVAAVRVGDRRWNLHMNSGVDVLLPEGHEDVALKKLVELEAGHQLLDRPLQVVDLRLPDRLVVRPMPDQKSDGHSNATSNATPTGSPAGMPTGMPAGTASGMRAVPVGPRRPT